MIVAGTPRKQSRTRPFFPFPWVFSPSLVFLLLFSVFDFLPAGAFSEGGASSEIYCPRRSRRSLLLFPRGWEEGSDSQCRTLARWSLGGRAGAAIIPSVHFISRDGACASPRQCRRRRSWGGGAAGFTVFMSV